MVQFYVISIMQIGVTSEIEELSKEMAACSGDAVKASESIKHYNTLKVCL